MKMSNCRDYLYNKAILMQILPSKELLSFTRHSLFLEGIKIDIKKIRFFSDGDTSIVFSLKENLISENKGSN